MPGASARSRRFFVMNFLFMVVTKSAYEKPIPPPKANLWSPKKLHIHLLWAPPVSPDYRAQTD